MKNKKAEIDLKTYLFGLIMFGLVTVISFSVYNDMASNPTYNATQITDSQVYQLTNQTKYLSSDTYTTLFQKASPNEDIYSTFLRSAWNVVSMIINSVTFPFEAMLAIEKDIVSMNPIFSIPFYIINAIVGLILVSLVIIFVMAILRLR